MSEDTKLQLVADLKEIARVSFDAALDEWSQREDSIIDELEDIFTQFSDDFHNSIGI